MIRKNGLVALALLLLLPACQTDGMGTRETVSAPLVTQTNPTPRPAALKAGISPKTAPAPDDADRVAAQKATQRVTTAPIGQQVTWNNAQSGNSGTLVPVRDVYASNGAYCREVQQTTVLDGQRQQAYTKLCQQPDGSWKITP